MDDARLINAIREAVRDELQTQFRAFGVDLKDQDSLNNYRDDLIWARKSRRAAGTVKSKVLMTAVTMVSGALFIGVWEAFKINLIK